MPQALDACLESGSPLLTMPSTWFVFACQGVTFFISNSTETKHGFFGTPDTQSCPTSSQINVFLFLWPREIRHLGLTFRKIFTNKYRNNLRPLWKSAHSKEIGSKPFAMGFHASQHRHVMQWKRLVALLPCYQVYSLTAHEQCASWPFQE